MKKITLIALMNFTGCFLFAQDCIPNPSGYSTGVLNCLKYKTSDSLKERMITWKDLEPLYDSILADNKKNGNTKDSMPTRDSAEKEIEVQMVKEVYDNFDTLYNRGERVGVNWGEIVFVNDASKLSREKDMPNDLWFNSGKVDFTQGDSIYEIEYKAMLVKDTWKIIDIGTTISVYDKYGTELGMMSSSYEDFSKQEFDTASAMIADTTTTAKPVAPTKKPASKKHSASSTTKQAIKKPDTN
jgi:hypothetical protein